MKRNGLRKRIKRSARETARFLLRSAARFISLGKKRIILLVARDRSGSNAFALAKTCPAGLPGGMELVFVYDRSSRSLKDYFSLWKDIYRSRVVVTTHGPFRVPKRITAIELWHGIALKGIGLMDSGITKTDRLSARRAMSRADYIVTSSASYTTLMNACYGLERDRYLETGYPRNDLLAGNRRGTLRERGYVKSGKAALFMPTYRSNRRGGRLDGQSVTEKLFGMDDLDPARLDAFLSARDCELLVKLHPNERENFAPDFFDPLECISLFDEARMARDDSDLYELLGDFDLLITDYSSSYVDFALLDRPMIFTPTDLASYTGSRSFLLGPYDDWTPGPKALNHEELERALTLALAGDDGFAEARRRIRDFAHAAQDGKAGSRIWSKIIELIKDAG